jgi:hypothetical protein
VKVTHIQLELWLGISMESHLLTLKEMEDTLLLIQKTSQLNFGICGSLLQTRPFKIQRDLLLIKIGIIVGKEFPKSVCLN